MKKVINPVMCQVSQNKRARGFCKIEYENGKLSICGVIGPKSNGDCWGSCGQCDDEIRAGDPVEGWTEEMVQRFCDIWDKWHLNDMRPYCPHQKELGWDKLASAKVTLYHYSMTADVQKKRKAAEEASITALREGKTFIPTPEQTKYAALPYGLTTWKEIEDENYKPKKPLFLGDVGFTETKTLGWLRPDEHPDGILTRPCPVCGYKYGTEWRHEEVPEEIINWLFALPDTTVRPAWI